MTITQLRHHLIRKGTHASINSTFFRRAMFHCQTTPPLSPNSTLSLTTHDKQWLLVPPSQDSFSALLQQFSLFSYVLLTHSLDKKAHPHVRSVYQYQHGMQFRS